MRRAIYLGTPHLGTPLERVGRVIAKLLRAVPDPYAQLAAQLAELRSDGVKDLGDADLRHQDRARGQPRIGLRDPRHPVPLLPELQHYLIAGSLSTDARSAQAGRAHHRRSDERRSCERVQVGRNDLGRHGERELQCSLRRGIRT